MALPRNDSTLSIIESNKKLPLLRSNTTAKSLYEFSTVPIR